MDPAVVEQLLKGAIPPGVFALVIFGLLWLKASRGEPPVEGGKTRRDWRHTFGPLLAMLVIFASWPIAFSFSFPPAEVFDRLPWIWLALGVVLVAIGPTSERLMEGVSTPPHTNAKFLRAAIGVLLSTLPFLIAATFTYPIIQLDVITTSSFGWFFVLSSSIGTPSGMMRTYPRVASTLQFVTLSVSSQVLILAFSSLKLGQAAGMLAAISAVLLVLTLWKRRDVTGPGLNALLWGASLLTLFCGIQTSETRHSLLYLILLSVAPFVAMLGSGMIPAKSLKLRLSIFAAIYLVPVLVALAIAFLNQPKMNY